MVFLPLEFAGHEGLVTIEQRETGSVAWCVSDGITDYESALAAMERRVGLIVSGDACELIWLVEHSPLYTAGTSAKSQDLIQPNRFPVHQAGRGGQYTYHGTGQRVAYVMLNIKQRQLDVRSLVRRLETWLIETLAAFNVNAEARPDRIGIWVPMPPSHGSGEKKIAAIGLRIRRGVTFHGISLNVEPDLEHFSGIVPCGIADHGVTSLANLGYTISMEEVDMALRSAFEAVFQSQTIDESATSIMAR